MLCCCGLFRVFYKCRRLHIKFRPYKYRKRLIEQEENTKITHEKHHLSEVISEMAELCNKVTVVNDDAMRTVPL